MLKVTVITGSVSVAGNLSLALNKLDSRQRQELRVTVVNLPQVSVREMSESFEDQIGESDIVLVALHGVSMEIVERVRERVMLMCKDAVRVYVGSDYDRLGKLFEHDREDPSLQEDKIASQRKSLIRDYWQGAGSVNAYHLLLYIARQYGGLVHWPEPAAPFLITDISIYDPAEGILYDTVQTYQKHWSATYGEHQETVAVLFMGSSEPLDMHSVIARLTERIAKFACVLPIALPSLSGLNVERLEELLLNGGGSGRPVDLLVNAVPFRLGAGPTGGDTEAMSSLLKRLEVPLIHPIVLSNQYIEDWQLSPEGLTPPEFLVHMMLPEMDGAIDMLPIAAQRRRGHMDESSDAVETGITLIEDRADRLVSRIRRWLELRRLPQHEKRISIIAYNYPPGEGNLFGASYLDTFASISRVLKVLKEQGYVTEEMTADELRGAFLDNGIVNSPVWSDSRANESFIRYPSEKYTTWLKESQHGQEMIEQWGEPPGEVMVAGTDFLIPGIVNGNVFIGLQPARDIHEHSATSYHDKHQFPPHQYFAFYHYLRDEFRTDAILHIGTHGTLEFQPGKEAAMSAYCVPDQLIQDIPHLYVYDVGNPSEAMIAKRRSHAMLVSHQAPPPMESELYGEYAELEERLHQYRQAERLQPDHCAAIWREISETASALQLKAYHPEDLEAELYRMRRSHIPRGLHVLGNCYDRESTAEYIKFVMRFEHDGQRSLPDLLAQLRGWNYAELLERDQIDRLQELDREAEEWVQQLTRSEQTDPPAVPQAIQESEQFLNAWHDAWHAGRKLLRNMRENHELVQLLRALDGKYIPARLSGDTVRHPNILPSGYNLYQFDARAVPTDVALKRGAAAADRILQLYEQTEGQLPQTIAMIMWGLETSRTQGETIGIILHLLGIRITGRNRFGQPQYDVIPLEQLGRPRMNIFVTICGFFRDMFPNLLDELSGLFQFISELDEPITSNWFKAASIRNFEKLKVEGIEAETAWDLACGRFFGPAESEYGTKVTKHIESKDWQEESELANTFMDGMHHVYSKNHRGTAAPKLFRQHMQSVDIVSQLRSNHEHEVTDLDHYYEFFGGMAKSVELTKGRTAELYITDTASENIHTEDARYSIQRGVATRLANPRWIDAMLEHTYLGGQQIARRMDNILGLAATTGKVDTQLFSLLHRTYVEDEKRSQQLRENNRWAYHKMLETLLESHQRAYWDATDEELAQIHSRYLELESDIENV